MASEVVEQWTYRHACALQAALRLTHERFASELGVALRTVTTWHSRPDSVVRKGLQPQLDRLYETGDDGVRARFAAELSRTETAAATNESADPVATLTIAIALVVDNDRVLIVCRRDADASGITWQFPAGIVKPGSAAQTVAVRETLAETGIRCAARRQLGSRIHPTTKVRAEYFVCDYLAGDAENRDPDENVDVIWAPKESLTRFIPAEQLFPPVLELLKEGA
jgi:8-oxo-dGTP diphosphatase